MWGCGGTRLAGARKAGKYWYFVHVPTLGICTCMYNTYLRYMYNTYHIQYLTLPRIGNAPRCGLTIFSPERWLIYWSAKPTLLTTYLP